MWPAGQEAVEEELIDVDMLEQECEAGESIEDNMYMGRLWRQALSSS